MAGGNRSLGTLSLPAAANAQTAARRPPVRYKMLTTPAPPPERTESLLTAAALADDGKDYCGEDAAIGAAIDAALADCPPGAAADALLAAAYDFAAAAPGSRYAEIAYDVLEGAYITDNGGT